LKTTLLSLIVAMMIPAVSSAKVEDFNAMISENAQSQQSLRTELKDQMDSTRQAQMKAPQREMIEVASDWHSHNSPTRKSMLTFQKESVEHRPSEAKQMQRLANEIKALDETF
jgi:hypothetical protein